MKNKMPVVGKRYKYKNDQANVINVDSEGITYIQGGKEYWDFHEDFWDYFEELPEDNLQEKKEVNEGFKVTMSCAYCHQELKEIDGKFQSNCECYKQNGYVSSKSHIEKGEVSEVERALEELKKIINYCGTTTLEAEYSKYVNASRKLVTALEAEKAKGTTDQENKYFQAGWVAAREMFRKPNNEIKEATELLQFQVNNYCKEYINEVDPAFLPPLFIKTLERAKNLLDALEAEKENKTNATREKTNQTLDKLFAELRADDMSKPEPKTDMKKECVEPASIWELTKEEIYRCNFSSSQIWLYEIFIESFEQMQKDIEELKRNKLEGK